MKADVEDTWSSALAWNFNYLAALCTIDLKSIHCKNRIRKIYGLPIGFLVCLFVFSFVQSFYMAVS